MRVQVCAGTELIWQTTVPWYCGGYVTFATAVSALMALEESGAHRVEDEEP